MRPRSIPCSARIATCGRIGDSDNGREFCGRPDQHPYEPFLQLEEIKHGTTRVKRPQFSGIVEHLHRTCSTSTSASKRRRAWF
jgi:hypothetical protein